MNYVLIVSCLASLFAFAVVRPRWRNVGPSLLDSYLIGLCLFAVGTFLVWIEGLANSEATMRISASAALSGTLGACLWSYFFRRRLASLNFFDDAKRFSATPNDQFAISLGLFVSLLASAIFLVAVFSHAHIRSLLLDALLQGERTLNQARMIVSSGSEGYFAPGYFKQFRDIIVPIVCAAAILCGGTFRRRGLFYATFAVALASVFISGQRLVIILYLLSFGTAFLIDGFSLRRHFSSWPVAVSLPLILVGVLVLTSNMLGRSDAVLSPQVEQKKQERWLADLNAQKRQATPSDSVERAPKPEAAAATDANPPPKAADPAPKSAQAPSPNEVSAPKGIPAQAANDVSLSSGNEPSAAAPSQPPAPPSQPPAPPPKDISETLVSWGVPGSLMPVVALAHRAVIAVPRENTISYFYWSNHKHSFASGWITDLAGIRPGTQKQLSNELFTLNWGGAATSVGDSSLGLANDVFYNAGWPGIIIVPALYALAFLLLDMALITSRSPLTSAAKLFIFFTIPLLYSPFLFVLHGGVVVVGILCYERLLQKGAFAFMGFRPQLQQPTR